MTFAIVSIVALLAVVRVIALEVERADRDVRALEMAIEEAEARKREREQ